MLPVSTRLTDTLRFGSYLVKARVTVYQNGSPTSYQAPISQAQITVSRTAEYRRQGSMTLEIVPPNGPGEQMSPLLPTSLGSLLAPFGPEVFIEQGIAAVPEAETDWVPLGLFRVVTAQIEDTTIDYIVTLTLYDRSWLVSQRKFKEPYNFPATSSGNFVAEIVALIDQVAPEYNVGVVNNIQPTTATVPTASYNQGSDPWQAALDMATAVGYELFFDVNGVLTGYPTPNPQITPSSWNFTDQTATALGVSAPEAGNPYDYVLDSNPFSVPVAATVTFTSDQVYNDIIVTGTGTQNAPGAASGVNAPILAEAQDTNPGSATYVNGPLGDIPEFVQSNFITSSAQAQQFAQNELAMSLAEAWTITVTTPSSPMFDIDDVFRIYRARLGLFGQRVVIDEIVHTVSYQASCELSGRVVT